MTLSITRRGALIGAGALAVSAAAPRAHAQELKRIVVAMPNSPNVATLEPVRDYGNVTFRMGYNL